MTARDDYPVLDNDVTQYSLMCDEIDLLRAERTELLAEVFVLRAVKTELIDQRDRLQRAAQTVRDALLQEMKGGT